MPHRISTRNRAYKRCTVFHRPEYFPQSLGRIHEMLYYIGADDHVKCILGQWNVLYVAKDEIHIQGDMRSGFMNSPSVDVHA